MATVVNIMNKVKNFVGRLTSSKVTRWIVVTCLGVALVIVGCLTILPPARFAFRQLLRVMLSYVSDTSDHIEALEAVGREEAAQNTSAARRAIEDVDDAHRVFSERITEHDIAVAELTSEIAGSAPDEVTRDDLAREVADILGASHVERQPNSN